MPPLSSKNRSATTRRPVGTMPSTRTPSAHGRRPAAPRSPCPRRPRPSPTAPRCAGAPASATRPHAVPSPPAIAPTSCPAPRRARRGCWARRPCASSTRTRPLSTRRIFQGVVAEQEHVARHALDGEVLVDAAHEDVLRLRDDVVVGVVRDCTAAGHRSEARAPAAGEAAVYAVAVQECAAAPAPGGESLGQHLRDLIELVAAQDRGTGRPACTDRTASFSLHSSTAQAATICCAMTSSGQGGIRKRVQLSPAHGPQKRHALHKLVAGHREETALWHSRRDCGRTALCAVAADRWSEASPSDTPGPRRLCLCQAQVRLWPRTPSPLPASACPPRPGAWRGRDCRDAPRRLPRRAAPRAGATASRPACAC